jgi:cysteinyl-tRNA synthetase
MADMRALGVKDPDVLTRVTEYVPNIIAFIKKVVPVVASTTVYARLYDRGFLNLFSRGQMVDDGLAYESNGSVYQSITKYQHAGHVYRKLKPGADTSDVAMQVDLDPLYGLTKERRQFASNYLM